MRLILTAITLLLISISASAETGLEADDYQQVRVVVETSPAGGGPIGVTRAQIRKRVELRLRSAGLTPTNLPRREYLYVKTEVSDSIYSLRLFFAFQPEGRDLGIVATWNSGFVDQHGGSAQPFMDTLDRLMDEFLSQYLKTNEK